MNELESVQAHRDQHSQPYEGNRLTVVIHPLYPFKRLPTIDDRTAPYLRGLFRVLNSESDVIVAEDPRDYHGFTAPLLEQKIVRDVIFTQPGRGLVEHSELKRLPTAPSVLIAGAIEDECVREFCAYLRKPIILSDAVWSNPWSLEWQKRITTTDIYELR